MNYSIIFLGQTLKVKRSKIFEDGLNFLKNHPNDLRNMKLKISFDNELGQDAGIYISVLLPQIFNP